MKTSGFHGCYAPGIASLRSRRLFIHSLLVRMSTNGIPLPADVRAKRREAADLSRVSPVSLPQAV